MEEPSPRGSRLALAGALAAMLLVGGAGFLLGRASEEPTEVARPTAAIPPPAVETEAAVGGPLDRAGLLALAAAAADAAAGGPGRKDQLGKLGGRRFELRLPFGCEGPAEKGGDPAMRWRYDRESGSLRIHVAPVVWTGRDWWPEEGAAGIEAVEGFWISRPWTSSEACPVKSDAASAAGAAQAAPLPQTLAIGQIFSADSSRAGRRNGQPYEAVVRVPEEELAAAKGFHLRISGRLAETSDGNPVRCRQPATVEQPPTCLVSVVLDEVAIENAGSGEVVATWDLRGDSPAPP